MACGLFCFAACDVLAKVLTADLPAFQIVWFRQLGLLSGVVVLLSIKGLTLLKTPRPMLQIGAASPPPCRQRGSSSGCGTCRWPMRWP